MSATITRWSNMLSVDGEQRVFDDWSDFRAQFDMPHAVTGKDQLAGWSPATFVDGRRGNDHAIAATALVLDYDGGTPMSSALNLFQLDGWAHTTLSSRPDNPRFRVIMPLEQPISREEHTALWIAARDLARSAGQEIDERTRNISRVWLMPGTVIGERNNYVVTDMVGPKASASALANLGAKISRRWTTVQR